jgi:hypothetical protein
MKDAGAASWIPGFRLDSSIMDPAWRNAIYARDIRC